MNGDLRFPDDFDAKEYVKFAEGLDYDKAMRMSEDGTWLYTPSDGVYNMLNVTGCEYRYFERAHEWTAHMERQNGMETVVSIRLDEMPGRMRRAVRTEDGARLYDGTSVKFGRGRQ